VPAVLSIDTPFYERANFKQVKPNENGIFADIFVRINSDGIGTLALISMKIPVFGQSLNRAICFCYPNPTPGISDQVHRFSGPYQLGGKKWRK